MSKYKHALNIILYNFRTDWGRTWDEITNIDGNSQVDLIETTTTRRIFEHYTITKHTFMSEEKFTVDVIRHITGSTPEYDSDSEGCYESEPIDIEKQTVFIGEDVDQDELDKVIDMFNC